MYIEKVIKTPNGNFEFKGELSPEELDFIVGTGISVLIQHGAMSFGQGEDEEDFQEVLAN